jgi:hypothetical protein
MRRSVLKTALPLLLITAMLAAPSCIFDPKEDPVIPVKDPVVWPDMTTRDDAIKVVVLAYQNPNDSGSDSKYNALLHSQYFFKLHSSDVEPTESQIMTRVQDLLSTEWIFDNQTMLELSITPEIGSWDAVELVEGDPCDNCWETTRSYYIRAQFEDEGTIYQSPPTSAFVRIIVAPDESDATKWVLRAMFDLGI